MAFSSARADHHLQQVSMASRWSPDGSLVMAGGRRNTCLSSASVRCLVAFADSLNLRWRFAVGSRMRRCYH